MDVLICYRRSAQGWARAMRDFLKNFAMAVFLDEHDHRSGEPWRPAWRRELERSKASGRTPTVLVLLGKAMARRPTTADPDVCHLEIEEALAVGARVVFLELRSSAGALFDELLAAYGRSGRTQLPALTATLDHHRQMVPDSVEVWGSASSTEQQECKRSAMKAVFDGHPELFLRATEGVRAWAQHLEGDRLCGSAELHRLERDEYFDSSKAGRPAALKSRALVGASGTGKSRLLARWILDAQVTVQPRPYFVRLEPEDLSRGVEALCSALGIGAAASQLIELGYARAEEVLRTFFQFASRNDQNRGFVLIIDSLERATAVTSAIRFLRAVREIPEAAIWVTCRRSAWSGRFEAAVDLELAQVADIDERMVADVLAGVGLCMSGKMPEFARRAVNLDILGFLLEQGLLPRGLPADEFALLEAYVAFALDGASQVHGPQSEDVRALLSLLAEQQIEQAALRVPWNSLRNRLHRADDVHSHLLHRARILREDRVLGLEGKALRLRHDRLDAHNIAQWCAQDFDARLSRVLATGTGAVGLIALGGLYRRLLARGPASHRARLFEEFLWVLDRKPYYSKAAEAHVPAETREAFNTAAWAVTYVLQDDGPAALPDVREALRGSRTASLEARAGWTVEDHRSEYDGSGCGTITLDAAVSIASAYRPTRGAPPLVVEGTDTVDVFAEWIFGKQGSGAQRFRFIEALSRFDNEANSSIEVFRRVFGEGLVDADPDLVKSLASSVHGREDDEAASIRELLLAKVDDPAFGAARYAEGSERLRFLRWFVWNELGEPRAAREVDDEVVRGGLSLSDWSFPSKASDWVDVVVALKALRRLRARDPRHRFSARLVRAWSSMFLHEHQRVREESARVLAPLFRERTARATVLALLGQQSAGSRLLAELGEGLRDFARDVRIQEREKLRGVLAGFLAELHQVRGLGEAAGEELVGAASGLRILYEQLVTPGALECFRFEDAPEVVLIDEAFTLESRAEQLIQRHAPVDPGPETETKYRVVGLDSTAPSVRLRLAPSSWVSGASFFAAVEAERAALETRAIPSQAAGPWLEIIDRREALLEMAEELAAGRSQTPGLLSVHALVRTRPLAEGEQDGDARVPSLLLARRGSSNHFYGGRRTASFEEQLTAVDWHQVGRGVFEACALRGFEGELRRTDASGEERAIAWPASGRIVVRSLILEPQILNLAVVVTMQLPWTRVEFEQELAGLGATQEDELYAFEFCPLDREALERLEREALADTAHAQWHPTTALRLGIARRAWLSG